MKLRTKTTTYLLALLMAVSFPALSLAKPSRQASRGNNRSEASSRSAPRQQARAATQQARPPRSNRQSRSIRSNRPQRSPAILGAAQSQRSNRSAGPARSTSRTASQPNRGQRNSTQNTNRPANRTVKSAPAATPARRTNVRPRQASPQRANPPVVRQRSISSAHRRPAQVAPHTRIYNNRPRAIHHPAPVVRHVYHQNYGWFGHYRSPHYRHKNHCVVRLYGGIGLGLGFYYGAFYPSYRSAYYYHHPWNTVYVYGSSPAVIYETSPPTVIVRQPQPTVIYETSPSVVVKESEPTVTLRESNDQQDASSQAARHVELTSQVLRDQDEKRLEAARLLADFPSIQTTATLTDVLINDADPDVRMAAAQTLQQLNDPLAYEALLRSAQAENEPLAQQAAEQAAQQIQPIAELENIQISQPFPPMNQGNPELAQLLENLRFAATADREKAAKEMAQHAGTQASAALINALMNDYDKEVRKHAARSLAQTGEHMALPYLNWAQQNDPEPVVREEAKKAIEKIQNAS